MHFSPPLSEVSGHHGTSRLVEGSIRVSSEQVVALKNVHRLAGSRMSPAVAAGQVFALLSSCQRDRKNEKKWHTIVRPRRDRFGEGDSHGRILQCAPWYMMDHLPVSGRDSQLIPWPWDGFWHRTLKVECNARKPSSG